MMSGPRKINILINGVTGYIGGSILTQFLKIEKSATLDYVITALVRKQEQAELLESKGIKVEIFSGLDNLNACRSIAGNYDVVITAGDGTHDASAAAWVQGLSDRQKRLQTDCYYVHTGGSSVVGYVPVLGQPVQTRVWSDMEPFSVYEKAYPEVVKQRTNRFSYSDLSKSEGIKTVAIVPTQIWGQGLGHFLKMSTQVAGLASAAKQKGQAFTVGQGNGVWNIVHIEDVSDLYVLAVQNLVANKSAPLLEIYWAENGTTTWAETSAGIARALKSQDVINTDVVSEVDIAEGARLLGNGDETRTVGVYASSSVAKADRGRAIGWEPKHSAAEYFRMFDDGEQFVKLYVDRS